MSEKVICTCRYRHPEIGVINIKVNASAKSLRARWVGPEVHITVPKNCPVTVYDEFIETNSVKLRDLRPQPRFVPGIINGNFADFEIRIVDRGRSCLAACKMETENPARGKMANGIIDVDSAYAEEMGFDSEQIQNAINQTLSRMAWSATGLYLLPHARELAGKIGHSPVIWDVKHSKTRLGWCSSSGMITLSPRLIFLPLDLAEFVIYHELAHLSEMNHSSAFHRVCNDYCDGREAEFNARVKAFRFPIY